LKSVLCLLLIWDFGFSVEGNNFIYNFSGCSISLACKIIAFIWFSCPWCCARCLISTRMLILFSVFHNEIRPYHFNWSIKYRLSHF
jgi:hypothetical protein